MGTSPTAILTIYIGKDAPEQAVDEGIAAILKVHPGRFPW
jgi:hypothetical protein